MAEGHPIVAFFEPLIVWFGERRGFAELRRRLLEHAEGRIVEIGAGAGPNFRHYRLGVVVEATEPDPHMLKRAKRAARKAGERVTVERAGAEALPFADGSVDTVVSTGVFCSVPDQAAALAEVKRILKPGGKLLLMEHVRSDDPGLAAKQDKAEPRQVRFGGGCHPNRDTLSALAAAGFDTEAIEHQNLPLPKLTRRAILGVARKPAYRSSD
jgi:ubiquinone/menaquinone biosynthesis C-methylase UbiE